MRYILFFLLIASSLHANTTGLEPVIDSLTIDDPQYVILRQEISLNLRSIARNKTIESPIRFFRYIVKENDNFFTIVARTMQNPETIATGNDISDPSQLKPGKVLLIPNARGVFVSGKREEVIEKYGMEHPLLMSTSTDKKKEMWFLPGVKVAFSFKHNEPHKEISGLIYPVPVVHITSGYGTRWVGGKRRRRPVFHGAIDFAAPAGTEVFAAKSGRVFRAERSKGYGNLVIIEHEDGYSTYYAHLSKINVKKGDLIEAGDVLGLVGRTGHATGPHLHFELRKNKVAIRPVFSEAISRNESSEP
jgi:murein DD-endopeptidase MepM/ murein hydrolase activator NlpD